MSARWGLPLVVAGALAGFLVARQPWWHATGSGGLSGSIDGGAAATALPLAVGAAVLLSLTLRTRGRRVVAALGLLLGLGMAGVGLWPGAPGAARVSAVTHMDAASAQLKQGAWHWAYAVVGLVVSLGALTLVLRRVPTTTSLGPVPAPDPDDPATLWKALDAGEDPTDDARG